MTEEIIMSGTYRLVLTPDLPLNNAPVVGTATSDQVITLGDSIAAITADFTDPDNDTLTYSILPSVSGTGLSFSTTTGVLSGTPTSAGDLTFTITASDGELQTSATPFTITTNPVVQNNTAPVVGNQPTDQTVVFGQQINAVSANFTDPEDDTLTYSISPSIAGSGLSFSTTTGVLSGTPSSVGDLTYSITASDGELQTQSASFTITTLSSASWAVDEVTPLPTGMTLLPGASDDYGYVDDWHPRLNKEVYQGKNCYKHTVLSIDQVPPVEKQSGGTINSPIFPLDYSTVTKILVRFHVWTDGHPGNHGKFIAALFGHGFIGDNWPSTPISNSQAHGSTEGAVMNLMHPKVPQSDPDFNKKNRLYTFNSHANNINLPPPPPQNQQYYKGDFTDRSDWFPGGQWNCVDLVIHKNRLPCYEYFLNGVRQSESDASDGPAFNNWNNQKAVWWRLRNMYGGPTSEEDANQDWNSWYGGFFIATE